MEAKYRKIVESFIKLDKEIRMISVKVADLVLNVHTLYVCILLVLVLFGEGGFTGSILITWRFAITTGFYTLIAISAYNLFVPKRNENVK